MMFQLISETCHHYACLKTHVKRHLISLNNCFKPPQERLSGRSGLFNYYVYIPIFIFFKLYVWLKGYRCEKKELYIYMYIIYSVRLHVYNKDTAGFWVTGLRCAGINPKKLLPAEEIYLYFDSVSWYSTRCSSKYS